MGFDQAVQHNFSRNTRKHGHVSGLEKVRGVKCRCVCGRVDHVNGVICSLGAPKSCRKNEAKENCDEFSGNRLKKEDAIFMNSQNKSPGIGSSPYVLHGCTSPSPSSPSGRCKSPFVPSFKDVTKIFSFPSFLWAKVDAFIERLNKWTKNADHFADHFWAHMKLGGSVCETAWGKMSLGAKIVTEGGVENLFRLSFSVGPTEKLVKTSSCYLSTSAGPIAGLLFISTEKVAFCSDRPLNFESNLNKKPVHSHYRVAIPLGRIDSVNQYENMNKPEDKYIQIRTIDDHEFWFMGFVNYKKALKHLNRAVNAN